MPDPAIPSDEAREAESLERIKALWALLRVYGSPQEQPTEKELWAGCKDAAVAIGDLLRLLDRERAARAETSELLGESLRCAECDLLPLDHEPWCQRRTTKKLVSDLRAALAEARKAMLTPDQIDGLADWMLKRMDLDNDAHALTYQILRQKAEAARAWLSAEEGRT